MQLLCQIQTLFNLLKYVYILDIYYNYIHIEYVEIKTLIFIYKNIILIIFIWIY